MRNIKYFTSDKVRELTEHVNQNLEWYYSREPDDNLEETFQPVDVRNSNLLVEPLRSKLIFGSSLTTSESDAKNAYTVFGAMKNLSPHQATDERLWVYLSHTECKTYATNRWLSDKKPADGRKIKKEISHFFVPSKSRTRNIFRSNAVSRLWWLGYLAHQVAPDDPKQFLEIILYRQDVANQILTRSTTANRLILTSIYEVLKEDWGKDRKLLQRIEFRNWMSKINIYGGVILLDALNATQKKNSIQRFSEAILSASADSQ